MFLDRISCYTVEDIMNTDILKIRGNCPLREALELMLHKNTGDILVVDSGGNLAGILTLTDISRVMQGMKDKRELDFELFCYCTRDVLTIDARAKAIDARNLMKRRGIGRLPVLKDGKVVGVIRVSDITNKVYPQIEETSKTLGLILNNLHEAVCVVDREGIVEFWNEKSERLYSVKSEEIVGKKLDKFFPNALLLRVLRERKPIENIYHSPREGNYVNISAIPIFIDGELVGAVSTERDVTEITNLTIELEETRNRLQYLQHEVNKISEGRYSFGKVIGKSSTIEEIVYKARQVAPTNCSILITGESGTGKEVFARAIHQASGREGSFVAVNCSAIPEHLFESEMFGYVGGAFTGALKRGKMGMFELADGGTIFLDEIGDMPIHMQAKLLRVLQEKSVTRIGSESAKQVDVRVISATNKDLKKLVEEGTFREDLYYRLNVVNIELPPLRDRKEDIPLLVKHFAEEFCRDNDLDVPRIPPEVLAVLMSYEWKGNIRELKNAVEHLVLFSKGGEVKLESVPGYILEETRSKGIPEEVCDLGKCIERAEVDAIRKAMKLAEGNKSKAAELLNIPRSTLYYKIKYYDLKEFI